jgi:hypothetical protein
LSRYGRDDDVCRKALVNNFSSREPTRSTEGGSPQVLSLVVLAGEVVAPRSVAPNYQMAYSVPCDVNDDMRSKILEI